MFESFRTLVRFAPGYDVADLQPAIYSLVIKYEGFNPCNR